MPIGKSKELMHRSLIISACDEMNVLNLCAQHQRKSSYPVDKAMPSVEGRRERSMAEGLLEEEKSVRESGKCYPFVRHDLHEGGCNALLQGNGDGIVVLTREYAVLLSDDSGSNGGVISEGASSGEDCAEGMVSSSAMQGDCCDNDNNRNTCVSNESASREGGGGVDEIIYEEEADEGICEEDLEAISGGANDEIVNDGVYEEAKLKNNDGEEGHIIV